MEQVKGSSLNNGLTLRDVLKEAIDAQRQIEKHDKTIRGLAGSVSDHLLTVAKGIQGKYPKAIKQTLLTEDGEFNKFGKVPKEWKEAVTELATKFQEDCRQTEKEFENPTTAPEGYKLEKNMWETGSGTLPRCWTQAKSNILAAIRQGLDLSKFDTESKMRKAKIAVNAKAAEEENRAELKREMEGKAGNTEEDNQHIKEVKDTLTDKEVPDVIAAQLATLAHFYSQMEKTRDSIKGREDEASKAMVRRITDRLEAVQYGILEEIKRARGILDTVVEKGLTKPQEEPEQEEVQKAEAG